MGPNMLVVASDILENMSALPQKLPCSDRYLCIAVLSSVSSYAGMWKLLCGEREIICSTLPDL